MTSKEIKKWADESMFLAEEIKSVTPRVTIVNATRDPLGQIAALAKAYQGKFVDNLEEICDADREYYLSDVQKNKLGMPLEGVQLHFRISGVTRGFTHQLVRQRMGAAYSQESMRFAVKEDFPVALPPSIVDANPNEFEEHYNEYLRMNKYNDGFKSPERNTELLEEAYQWAERTCSTEGRMRRYYDDAIQNASVAYNTLIAMGMPAEDARFLAPTSIQTQINYVTSLRGLMDHAGLRLCTQAQFEWKQVWVEILQAFQAYADRQHWYYTQSDDIHVGAVYGETGKADGSSIWEVDEAWQWREISKLFKPICYKTGKCEFMSDFDRYCPIRERVEANHKIGRPSSEWESSYDPFPDGGTAPVVEEGPSGPVFIGPIFPAEWVNPKAAIRQDGDWRKTSAQENIQERR